MPWLMYSGMTEKDLGAIYDYLRTVQPIKYKVERFKRKGWRRWFFCNIYGNRTTSNL